MTVLGNPTAALGLAQASVGDDAAMGALRAAVARTQPPGVALVNLDDAAVAELAACAMAAGTLHLGAPQAPPQMFRIAITPPAPPPPAPAASAAPRAQSSAAPPPAETTFASTLDAAAMVAVLAQASRDGVAFCEECARAAAGAAA